jgi:hypothetical protein
VNSPWQRLVVSRLTCLSMEGELRRRWLYRTIVSGLATRLGLAPVRGHLARLDEVEAKAAFPASPSSG